MCHKRECALPQQPILSHAHIHITFSRGRTTTQCTRSRHWGSRTATSHRGAHRPVAVWPMRSRHVPEVRRLGRSLATEASPPNPKNAYETRDRPSQPSVANGRRAKAGGPRLSAALTPPPVRGGSTNSLLHEACAQPTLPLSLSRHHPASLLCSVSRPVSRRCSCAAASQLRCTSSGVQHEEQPTARSAVWSRVALRPPS